MRPLFQSYGELRNWPAPGAIVKLCSRQVIPEFDCATIAHKQSVLIMIAEWGPCGAANRLLIVDDEGGITRIIEIAARQVGFEVLAIHDTDQFERALDAIRPTVIFLDITMSGRDGMELIGYLAAGSYPGKIVVVSGSDELHSDEFRNH